MGKIDYENLRVEMARAGISFPSLADMIRIGKTTIYSKKTGERDWTLKEMKSIQDVLQQKTGLDLPLDYLFSKKVIKEGGN